MRSSTVDFESLAPLPEPVVIGRCLHCHMEVYRLFGDLVHLDNCDTQCDLYAELDPPLVNVATSLAHPPHRSVVVVYMGGRRFAVVGEERLQPHPNTPDSGENAP